MKLTDKEVTGLIRTCAADARDLFFALRTPPALDEIAFLASALGSRVLTLLPGTVYPCGETQFTVLNAPEDLASPPVSDALFADIRLLCDPAFAAYIQKYRLRFLLLPFYETALPAEYGSKFSYRQIAELRASLPFPLCVIGISARDRMEHAAEEAFGTRIYYVVGEPETRRLYGVKTESDVDKFFMTALQCEKTRIKTHILLCATRTGAQRLQAFLKSWGVVAELFHGGRDKAENAAALEAFCKGETQILIATKSLLPSYPFLKADKLYYFGLPYSVAHADRCASLSKTGELTCFWCDNDAETLRRLTEDYAKALHITDTAFFKKRNDDLNEIVRLFNMQHADARQD